MKIHIFLGLLALAACASAPSLRNYEMPQASIELSDTPFFPQKRYQCGPAALATVLAADGVEVTPEGLTPYVYLPERRGSLRSEMVAATRRFGRMPYLLRPRFDDLLKEVSTGNPVLVMLNLGIKPLPRWHYAVVIGYHVPSDSLILRSATSERLQMARRRFLSAWRRADNWALVTVSPDNPPATASSVDWLRTASAFEELGQIVYAAQAYAAATRRWPTQSLSWQALANARYALGDTSSAEVALRHALQIAPSVASHNNLAHILQERGCSDEASRQVELAEALPGAEAFVIVLQRTRAAIRAGSGRQATQCPSAADIGTGQKHQHN